MKANLLLLDSYNNIESLINYAFSFSQHTGRRLKILYVFDFEWMRQSYTVGSASVADPVLVNVQHNARKEFEEAEKRIKDAAEHYVQNHVVTVQYEISISDKNRIDLMVEETNRNPDLILMISNKQSYAEASGGLTAYPNLLYHVNCPVYVIPESTAFNKLRNIVYAANLHSEDIEALKHLSELFQSSDTQITVLHNGPENEYNENLKWKGFVELIKETTGGDSVVPVIRHEKKAINAIEHYIGKHDVDLVVLLKEKKGFFKDMFSTSHTKKVLTHFDKPVLVYHEH